MKCSISYLVYYYDMEYTHIKFAILLELNFSKIDPSKYKRDWKL